MTFTATGTAAVVNVTGVTLDKDTAILAAGATDQLTATVAPADATNKNVTWSSSNPAAATVSSTGLITALAVGSATITVTTEDGGFTDTCAVTVDPAGTVLAVKYQGTTVKSYTMAQLRALTAFSGYAGTR